MLKGIARWCFKHRIATVTVWLCLLVVLTVCARYAGDAFTTEFRMQRSDSQTAGDILRTLAPSRAGVSGQIVFKTPLSVDDPTIKQNITAVLQQYQAFDHVVSITSPYAAQAAQQISMDRTIAYAVIQFDTTPQVISKNQKSKMRELITSQKFDNLQIALGGDVFIDQYSVGNAEFIGISAAMVILLIAFGSIIAMGLPIITALFGLGIGLAVVKLMAHVFTIPSYSLQLAAMIGIGVGIDYALFIVNRYRESLRKGQPPIRAIATAVDTAGRSVLFAGTTVVVALSSMLLIGVNFLQGMGLGAAAVVVVTMLASITLLPAVLGFVGNKIDTFSIHKAPPKAHVRTDMWFRWSRFLQRHPWPPLLIGVAILSALIVPVFSIRLGSADASSRPTSDTTRQAYDIVAEGFGPGSNGPLLLVAKLSKPADMAAIKSLGNKIQGLETVAVVVPPQTNADNSVAVMQVIPKTSPQDEKTVQLISDLRTNELASFAQKTGITVHVGGITAIFDDLAATLQSKLPIFIGIILSFSFLLLMVIFRSIYVPIKAVILNAMSISAAYGVLVMVFQWGWGRSLLGVGNNGPIESFVPLMLFAILFGLSMDYEIFLLSRIRESYVESGDNALAVADGLNHTARIISAAAAIMVTVFASFVFINDRVIKEFGIGLAVAIFLDATVVRLVLVPAVMELIGNANWWFPSWLRWVPDSHIEGDQ